MSQFGPEALSVPFVKEPKRRKQLANIMNGCHQKAEGDEDKAVWPQVIREGFLARAGRNGLCVSSAHAFRNLSDHITGASFAQIFFLLQCFNSSVP